MIEGVEKMHTIKKKFILPLIVFLIGMGILIFVIYNAKAEQQNQSQIKANLNAMTYAEHMKTDIMQGIGVTDTLKQILISENGKINKFFEVAKNMMTDSIQSIQIAPDGVVTEIYPEKGNEAGKIDLIHDKERGKISRYSRDNHILTMQGPFQLKQGGYGIAVRNPVYLKNKKGQESFWGFTIVIIRVPEIFSESVRALSNFGYEYRLLKTVSPWDLTYEEVYSSGNSLINPMSYSFELDGSWWKLEVMPKTGWDNSNHLYWMAGGGILIILLLTGLTTILLIFDENRQRFRKLAITDTLTEIYNRHGFDESVAQYLKRYPNHQCVAAQFDIDDFKFINDMYGHATGDAALKTLSKNMKKFFPKNAILGRNGGDEFCVFLPDCTCKEAKEEIEQFVRRENIFLYKGEKQSFTISLGYAQYPLHAKDLSQLMRCADAALYEVKLRGKHGCLVYQEGLHVKIRTQLGFSFKDISENLPGAFVIYRANKIEDEILFANLEFLQLAGCKNMDELLEYTNKSFRNLIRKDERKNIEESIWQQIEEGTSKDYVYYHLQKKNGDFLKVLDYGKIVENNHYGKVFYVLIVQVDKFLQENCKINVK